MENSIKRMFFLLKASLSMVSFYWWLPRYVRHHKNSNFFWDWEEFFVNKAMLKESNDEISSMKWDIELNFISKLSNPVTFWNYWTIFAICSEKDSISISTMLNRIVVLVLALQHLFVPFFGIIRIVLNIERGIKLMKRKGKTLNRLL